MHVVLLVSFQKTCKSDLDVVYLLHNCYCCQMASRQPISNIILPSKRFPQSPPSVMFFTHAPLLYSRIESRIIAIECSLASANLLDCVNVICTAERTFSALCTVKNYLITTMTQKCLNNVMLLHVHNSEQMV